MPRKIVTLTALIALGASLLLSAAPAGLRPDEIIVRYPQGYTRVLMADLAKLLNDPVLAQVVMGGLRAARQPLNGIAEIVQNTLQLDVNGVRFVAHGEGPGLTSFSLLQGIPAQAALGPLLGLQFAAGAPGSPFTNWELTQSRGLPVVRTGGTFGPVNIQWAYLPTAQALWVGTEVAFGAAPDEARLLASTDRVAARVRGQTGYFDELLVGLSVRGGDVAFVRRTDPALDQPLAAGEQAMGFALNFTSEGARVRFDLRFARADQAAEALAELRAGSSPYLAQGLFQGELLEARQQGTGLNFSLTTDLRGAVGLLLTVMPN